MPDSNPLAGPPPVVPPPLTDVLFPLVQMQMQRLVVLHPPNDDGSLTLDPATQEAQLGQSPVPPGVDFTVHSGAKYRPLETWLQAGDQAQILCRQNGLRIVLHAAVDASINLFRVGETLTATLSWQGDAAHPAPRTVAIPDVEFDLQQRELTLNLPFGSDAAGHQLYGDVTNAMTSPSAQATVVVSYEFGYSAMRSPKRPIILFADKPGAPTDVAPAGDTAPQILEHRLMPLSVLQKPQVADLVDRVPLQELLHDRIPIDPIFHFPPPQPQLPPVPTDVTMSKTFSLAIGRARDAQPNAYPDLPKPGDAGAWGTYTPEGDAAPVFYKASQVGDEYYYLPTSYNLGFLVEDGRVNRPPIAALNYVDGAGHYRVKVTLVALPTMDTQLREALRTNICRNVLQNIVPYVRLMPAPGLAPAFVDGSFVPESAGAGSTNLPASVRVISVDLVTEKRLVFMLDMDAFDYAIVCELLRHGIRGRLSLGEPGFSHVVDVLLRLDDVSAQVMSITASQLRRVRVENLLDYPVHMDSLKAILVARGEVAGMVFGAESHELLDGSGHLFDAAGSAGAVLEVSVGGSQTGSYSDVALALGNMRAQAGTPDEWLARVSRDPSLSPQGYTLRLEPVASDRARQTIQALTVGLYRDGESAPRLERPVLLTSPSTELAVQTTLADLMGTAGKAPTFSLEYYSRYSDGTLGLPQRVALDATVKELPLLPLVETAASHYTVEYLDDGGSHRQDVDRNAATSLIALLRQAGHRWTLSAREPDPTGTGATGTGTTGTGTSGTGAGTGSTGTTGTGTAPVPYAGPPVVIVTALLAAAFGPSKLQEAFVVLQAAGSGAPSSSYVFDAANQAQQSWRPATGTIPPFSFHITYLYAGGATRVVEGSGANLMLVLDPPGPPAPPTPPPMQ